MLRDHQCAPPSCPSPRSRGGTAQCKHPARSKKAPSRQPSWSASMVYSCAMMVCIEGLYSWLESHLFIFASPTRPHRWCLHRVGTSNGTYPTETTQNKLWRSLGAQRLVNTTGKKAVWKQLFGLVYNLCRANHTSVIRGSRLTNHLRDT